MRYFTLYGQDNRAINYTHSGIKQLLECGAKLLYLAKNEYKIVWR